MIAPLLLAAALAVAPAPEPAPATTPPSAKSARLDVPMTLHVKDAALVDLLEKLADLLGVTPILDPGVKGKVTLSLQDVPLSDAICEIGKQGGVEITVSGKLLRVRLKDSARTAGEAPSPSSPPTGAPGAVLRFWLEGSEDRPVAVRVPSYIGRIDLPGCTEPVTIAPLGPSGEEPYGAAIGTRDRATGRPMAMILYGAAAEGRKVRLPGCDGKLVVERGDAAARTGIVEPRRVEKGEPLVAKMRLVEVTEESEEILSAPQIAFRSDGGWSVKSGWVAGEPERYEQEIEIHGVALEARPEEDSVLLAVLARVTRTPSAAGGAAPLAARRAESFWLRKGRPVRWTVDSSWDGGRAALVLQITLERTVAAPR